MPGTTGLYFPDLTQPEANALRARLNDLAGALGYVARSGPTTGENRGVLAHLLVGIDAGEVAVVKLAEEELELAQTELEGEGEGWKDIVAAALWAATIRTTEADERAEAE